MLWVTQTFNDYINVVTGNDDEGESKWRGWQGKKVLRENSYSIATQLIGI